MELTKAKCCANCKFNGDGFDYYNMGNCDKEPDIVIRSYQVCPIFEFS